MPKSSVGLTGPVIPEIEHIPTKQVKLTNGLKLSSVEETPIAEQTINELQTAFRLVPRTKDDFNFLQKLMLDSNAYYTLDLMTSSNPSIIRIQVGKRQIFVFARKAISRISISN